MSSLIDVISKTIRFFISNIKIYAFFLNKRNQKTSNGPRRTNSNKPPAPATPKLNTDKTRVISASVTSLNKNYNGSSTRLGPGISERSINGDSTNSGTPRTRKAKSEAPKPPGLAKTPSQRVQNTESFHKRESLEDLTQMDSKRRNDVKRSASNHGNRLAQGTVRLITKSYRQFFSNPPLNMKRQFK